MTAPGAIFIHSLVGVKLMMVGTCRMGTWCNMLEGGFLHSHSMKPSNLTYIGLVMLLQLSLMC
jgi:hypothetical protein